MQVILNKDVSKLGYRGDIVNVRPGYFRNFLLPRGLADRANESRLKVAASRKDKLVMQRQQILDNTREVLQKLKGLKVTIRAKTSAKGKLYGSITELDVIAAIEAAAKVKLEKDFVKMEHFKDLGEHKVTVHLGEGLEEAVTVVVEAAGESGAKKNVVKTAKKTAKKSK